MSEERQNLYHKSIPILLEGFPFDLDGALIYHEFETYAIAGEIKFGKDYAFLVNGWVITDDKEFFDDLDILVVEWEEGIRNSVIEHWY